MDAESSGFKLRRVGAFNDIRCRAKPGMTGLLSLFSSLATIFHRFAPDTEFSRPRAPVCHGIYTAGGHAEQEAHSAWAVHIHRAPAEC